MSNKEDTGGPGSRVFAFVQYGVGGLLVLRGLVATSQGAAGVLAGIVWAIAGLVALPLTRRAVFKVLERAGGLDFGTNGRIVIAAIIVIGGFFAGAVIAPAGGSGIADTSKSTPTSTVGPTPESATGDSPEEQSRQLVRSTAESEQFVDEVQEVSIVPDFQGRDGFSVELRYDLDTEGLGMTGSQADDAEHRAGTVAREIIKTASEDAPNGLVSVAVYAYVPTSDGGSSVSTKVVVDLTKYEDIDWSAYPWQNLREDADQYKFNRYLYE
jgi:hypothetical protein